MNTLLIHTLVLPRPNSSLPIPIQFNTKNTSFRATPTTCTCIYVCSWSICIAPVCTPYVHCIDNYLKFCWWFCVATTFTFYLVWQFLLTSLTVCCCCCLPSLQEPNAFFVTTNMWVTCNQTYGECPEVCAVLSACPRGKVIYCYVLTLWGLWTWTIFYLWLE